jgi:hypothetical protein
VESSILRHILLDFDGDNFNGGLSGKLRPEKLGATGGYQGHKCPIRPSLLQMTLVARLKAGFEKGANCRCGCKGYRPELRIGNFPRLFALELWISWRSVGIKWTSFAIAA